MTDHGFLKLIGTNWSSVINTTSTKLGRRQKVPSADILVIGDAKKISREHAILEWDGKQGHWTISCLGKNGLALNGRNITSDDKKVVIHDKTRIEIAESVFWILFPEKT